MFETAPIIYLQSLGPPWFTFLMTLITMMGSSPFLIATTTIIIFGIDFKKGFLLIQLLLWTGLIVEALKIVIAFPRPDFVDNRVLSLEYGTKNTWLFSGNGSQGIFALPGKQVLTAFHLRDGFTFSPFGFPSGHAALTTALWGAIAIVFNSRTIKILTPFAIVIIAFSRVYLGRHFIADVMGGVIVGLITLVIFTYFLKTSLRDDLFKKESFELALRRQNVIFYSFMFVIPVILLALSLITSEVAGLFIGANVAYILIIRKGIPDDAGSAAQRAARVFIALLLLAVSGFILYFCFKPPGTINYLQFTLTGFLRTFIPASTIWISMAVCTKLGLYGKYKESL